MSKRPAAAFLYTLDRIGIRPIKLSDDDAPIAENALQLYTHIKDVLLQLDPDKTENSLKGLDPKRAMLVLERIAEEKGIGSEFKRMKQDLEASLTQFPPQSSLIPTHDFIATQKFTQWLQKELKQRYPDGAPYDLSYAVVDVLMLTNKKDDEALLFPISLVSKFTWKIPQGDKHFIGPLFILNSSLLRFKGKGFDATKASPLDRILSGADAETYTAADMQKLITGFLHKVQEYRGVDGVIVSIPNRHKQEGFHHSIVGRIMTGGHVLDSETNKPFRVSRRNSINATTIPEIRSGSPVEGDNVLFFLNKPDELDLSEGSLFRRCCEEARVIHRDYEKEFNIPRSDSSNRILDDILIQAIMDKAVSMREGR